MRASAFKIVLTYPEEEVTLYCTKYFAALQVIKQNVNKIKNYKVYSKLTGKLIPKKDIEKDIQSLLDDKNNLRSEL